MLGRGHPSIHTLRSTRSARSCPRRAPLPALQKFPTRYHVVRSLPLMPRAPAAIPHRVTSPLSLFIPSPSLSLSLATVGSSRVPYAPPLPPPSTQADHTVSATSFPTTTRRVASPPRAAVSARRTRPGTSCRPRQSQGHPQAYWWCSRTAGSHPDGWNQPTLASPLPAMPCFIICFQVFHVDVAYVAIAIYACCKRMFHVVSISFKCFSYFQTYVSSVSSVC
jgi:hypothetical protein